MPARTRPALTAALAGSALAASLLAAGPATAAPVVAPGAPGGAAVWDPADKHGFGTAMGTETDSPVWFTLRQGALSEVFYPDLGTPALRGMELVVSDGTRARSTADVPTRTSRPDARSLTFRQVSRLASRWELTATYVTDPAAATVTARLQLRSLDGKAYRVFAAVDPSLSNDGDDDTAAVTSNVVLASDARAAVTLASSTGLGERSVGYRGTRSDGLRDLLRDGRLDGTWTTARKGNVVLTAEVAGVTGRSGRRNATLALGFAPKRAAATTTARRTLARGWARTSTSYAAGWDAYLDSLAPVPASAASVAEEYLTSVMVLAASEDKRHPGAYVASPSAPWVWGQAVEGLSKPSGAYHLVWSRDLYQHATALLAAGDRAGAERALSFLLFRQQKADGSYPQNSTVDGTPEWQELQLDEVALPLVLAWQLGRTDPASYAKIKAAADFLVGFRDEETGLAAPFSPQERWENQSGYSPATIAAQVAGLVCAADLARRVGDTASADAWLATARDWHSRLSGWTVTTTGPYSSQPYYLRLSKDGAPDTGTTYDVGDGGATLDQRAVVDPSFLEVVRLGLVRAGDPIVENTLDVVDEHLGVSTPYGRLWHRFTGDGYGETRKGADWEITEPGTFRTLGRAWPIFAGERGEYDVLLGDTRSATHRLRVMAAAANDGGMIAEQVWDGRPPSGLPGSATGTGTRSATPLTWSHAQLVRLALSIDAGRPVEQPTVVTCTFLGTGC